MEEEKTKIKKEDDSISSNMTSSKRPQPDPDGHCHQHCPHAKKTKTYKTTTDPDDTLPDLPEIQPTEVTMTKDPIDKNKPSSESKTSHRSGVTQETASLVPRPEATIDVNKTGSEQDTLSQPVVTYPAGDLTNITVNVINIVPWSEQAEDDTEIQHPVSEKELEPSSYLVYI